MKDKNAEDEMMDDDKRNLGDVIREGMAEGGFEPAVFDKPLKSIGALVKFTKVINPEHIVENHAAVGWGMVALLEQFGKDLFHVRKLSIINSGDKVEIEGIVFATGLTFEDDHAAWFDGLISMYEGDDIKQGGYYWKPRYWRWDKVERISDITGFNQMKGDGIKTGELE